MKSKRPIPLFAVAQQEGILLWRDRTLPIVILLLVLLFGFAAWNGGVWTHKRAAALAKLHQADAKPATREGVQPETQSCLAALPLKPLAPLSVGDSDLRPYATHITLSSMKHSLFTNYEIDSPLTLSTGHFDTTFVVVYLLPLLILLLTHDLLSGDKERGILSLTLSQPVGLQRYVLAKIGVRVSVGVGLSVFFSVLGAICSGAELSAPGAVVGLVQWTLLVLVYGAFWFAIGLWVTSFGLSSAANAAIGGGFWLGIALIVPSLLGSVASAAHPIPSRLQMVQKSRAADNEARREGEKLLSAFYLDHPELAPKDAALRVNVPAQRVQTRLFLEKAMLPDANVFEARVNRQRSLIDRWRFLSPTAVAFAASTQISGTDRDRHAAFVSQTSAFVDQWRRALLPSLVRAEPLSPEAAAALPRFVFQEPDDVVLQIWGELLTIAPPAVMFLILALVRLRRYPVI